MCGEWRTRGAEAFEIVYVLGEQYQKGYKRKAQPWPHKKSGLKVSK